MFVKFHELTAFCEATPLERLPQHVDEYFSLIAQTVEHHRGLIIDFIGDVAMAIYGAPADNAAHALDAVQAALQLQGELEALNIRWAAQGLPSLRVGIGIHTGNVFAGSVGSLKRKKYTIMGDAVNVASLVEGLNAELQTTLLITKDTYAALQERVTAVDRGEMKLEGRQQAVNVYEVLCLAKDDHAL
jgi:adenylate cyclase